MSSGRGRPAIHGNVRRVKLFDAEKKHALGTTGYYYRSFIVDPENGLTEDELNTAIVEARDLQSKKNQKFREHQKIAKLKKSLTVEDEIDYDEQEESEEERRIVEPRIRTGFKSRSDNNIVHLTGIDLRLDSGTGNSTALIGSSKQGKSTCMMHLYKKTYVGKEWISVLFAANPQIGVYNSEKIVVMPEYDPRFIQMAQSINRRTSNQYSFLFLIDDIVDRRDDVVLKQLILTYRNSNISSMICLQYTNLLAKVSRANINNLLLFGFNSDEAIDIVCRQFLATHFRELRIPTDDWVKYYRNITSNHGFFYVHPATNEVSYHRISSV